MDMEAAVVGWSRHMAAAEFRFHKAAVGSPEDILVDSPVGKEACFAVDFVGFDRLVGQVEVDSSCSGHRPEMGRLAELAQALACLIRFFYGALPL